MNKNEIQHHKNLLDAKTTDSKIRLISQILRSATYLIAIWLIFDGLHKVIAGQNSDGIGAVAKVIEALHIGTILGYVWGGTATLAYMHERKGKKRLVREKNKYQRKAEQADLNRTSSGLTETGGTPEEEEE
jgi:hypothetical protein